MELFGIEITGEHARLIVPVLGAAIAGAGYVAGRIAQHRRHVSFKHEDLVSSSVTIEMYAIARENGRNVLHIATQGQTCSLQEFFKSADLVRHVQSAAAKHPGLLKVKNPIAHRMMMDEGKDALTGLDAKANMDFVHGRPTRDDETLFAFAAYAEKDRDQDGLRDQVARLVLMVVSPVLAAELADPDVAAQLDVAHAGYLPRCGRLRDFAQEWQRLQSLPHEERSAATDKIWSITVRTSLE